VDRVYEVVLSDHADAATQERLEVALVSEVTPLRE
jgi:hypothetical protein